MKNVYLSCADIGDVVTSSVAYVFNVYFIAAWVFFMIMTILHFHFKSKEIEAEHKATIAGIEARHKARVAEREAAY